MIVTLTNGETIFEVANGYDRTTNVLDVESFTLSQETDEEILLRAAWPTYYPDRAVRRIPVVYPVTFAPCASMGAAVLQARTIPLTCPKGGVLTEQHGDTLITYASAKLVSCAVERIGISNRFSFAFEATNPDTLTLSRLAQMDDRYLANLTDLTGLTGGGSTKLDGLTTTDVAPGFLATLILNNGTFDELQEWQLVAGTDAESTADGIVRPDDYDGTTNAKVWKRRR